MAEQKSNLKKSNLKKELSKQPLLVEAAVSTAANGALAAAVAALLAMLVGASSLAPLKQTLSFLQLDAGGPWVQARNFAVLSGAEAAISRVMRRFRSGSGREDVLSRVVAVFGSAVLYSLVSVPPAAIGPFCALYRAFAFALLFTLVRVGFFQLKKYWRAPGEDEHNAKTKGC